MGGPRRPRLRPTLGVVAQALFNSLGERVAGADVLDLFAGTGALGLEALRRGAARATFVEADARLADALRRAAAPHGPAAEVRRGKVAPHLAALAREGRRFDVVLLDPPYGRGLQRDTLERLAGSAVLAPDAVVVAEGHWRDEPPARVGGLARTRAARYGETALWFYRREGAAARDEPDHADRRRGDEGGAGRVIVVYPGSFDPVHLGHLDVIRRAAALFDRVIVAIAMNSEKAPLFSAEERLALLRDSLVEIPGAEADAYQGLTVAYARSRGARALIKGLRSAEDYGYETRMAAMNDAVAPDVETLFLPSRPAYAFLSSTLLKEVARLGGDVSPLVPANVADRLRERFRG